MTTSAPSTDRPVEVERTRRSFLAGGLVGMLGGVAGATVFHAVGHMTDDDMAVDDTAVDHAADHADIDIGFCTDMAAHHLQAIVMCERVLGRDTGDSVQAAATEVIRNQSIEIGMMRAWLTDWGASTANPERVMAWMADHESMTSSASGDGEMDTTTDGTDADMATGIPLSEMPGYATDEELRLLAAAQGLAKGKLWLELMRAHHVGGVAMAEAAAGLSSTEKVVRLAETQAEVQSWEIGQYDLLLSTIYA